MALAWFLCPMKRRPVADIPTRYCAADDFRAQIKADGGGFSYRELLGQQAIVKVSASIATLTAMAAAPGFTRLPKDRLDDPLSSLTPGQRDALRARLEAMGYPVAEIVAALGSDIRSKTLGDVLRFAATRRLKPRYDAGTDTIICDGEPSPCGSVDDLNGEVR